MIRSFFDRLDKTPYTIFSIYDVATDSVSNVASGDFLAECQRWADILLLRPETVVTIFGRTDLAMTSAWFGAILADKLPAYISYPSSKIQGQAYQEKLDNYQKRFGDCCFIGASSDREFCQSLLTTADLGPPSPPPFTAYPGFSRDGDKPLFLQCSSGSTGLQKAVAVTGNGLNQQINSYKKAINLDPKQDHIINWLPLYHDMGLLTAQLLPLLTQTAITHIDTFEWAANPDCFFKQIEKRKGTLCWLPNFAFSFLSRSKNRYDLSGVRSFINCSEPVSIGGFQRFWQTFAVQKEQLGVSYALAENVFGATQTPVGQPPKALLLDKTALQRRKITITNSWQLGDKPPQPSEQPIFSCGRAIDGVNILIKTRRDDEQVGEVWLSGACTVSGYYGAPPSHENGWLATGDMGFIHQGELYLCGRSKDLIIHNGKNIYPQDLEEVTSQHPEVHSGRVAAVGTMDNSLDSEKILVLFEPKLPLTLNQRNQICGQLSQKLEALFDIRAQLVAVPKGWLKKTSSGKVSRSACLESYLNSQEGEIHLVGDSHVRLFWSTNTSHHNRFKRVHAHWVGLLWADNWKQSFPFFGQLIPQLKKRDILIIHCGEPECRTLFAVSKDPLARIEQSIDNYQQFFATLKKVWPGRIAYLTGIPTHPQNIENNDKEWPITGTPEARYHYQKIFYQKLQNICSQEMVQFIDICSPLLENNGFMDPGRLMDAAHLKRDPHTDLYWNLFEKFFGYLDDAANDPPVESQSWDGSFTHFQDLVRKKIQTMAPLVQDPDWNQLVSTGVLDSLAIVELVAMLDQVFSFNIPPEEIYRENFESIDGLYRLYGPQQDNP